MALDHFRSLLLQSSLVWKFSPFALNLFLLYNVIRHIAYTCASTVHACKLWINDIKRHAKKKQSESRSFWFLSWSVLNLLFIFLFFFIYFQTLYNQFKFFLNMYFLVVATSQFIPELRIGYLYTYWGPLVRD